MFCLRYHRHNFIFLDLPEGEIINASEKAKSPETRKAEATKKLTVKANELKNKVNGHLKNTDPAIQTAINHANQILAEINKIDTNTDINTIEQLHLSQILTLLDYFEFQTKLPYEKNKLTWSVEQNIKKFTQSAAFDFYRRMNDAPDFSDEVKAHLKTINQQWITTISQMRRQKVMGVIPSAIDLTNFSAVRDSLQSMLNALRQNKIFPLPEENAISKQYEEEWKKAEEQANQEVDPQIPERPSDAPPASVFLASIKHLPREQQMAAIKEQIERGNIPNFMRKLVEVKLTKVVNGQTIEITTKVTPHYMAIGDDNDYFVVPMNGELMGAMCNKFKMRPPTTKLVEAIQKQAEENGVVMSLTTAGELAKQTVDPQTGEKMSVGWNSQVFGDHEARCMESLEMAITSNNEMKKVMDENKDKLTAGGKKDVVIDGILLANDKREEFDKRVVIYGAKDGVTGGRVQPLSDIHFFGYTDYSQGGRLVHSMVKITIKNRDGSIAKDANGKEIKDRPMRYDNAVKGKKTGKVLSSHGFKVSGMYEIKPL